MGAAEWRTEMTLMLCACIALILVLLVGLFGVDGRGGFLWVWGKWSVLRCYAACCRCSPRYQQVLEERGEEIKVMIDE